MKHLYKIFALLICAGSTCLSAEAQPVKYTAAVNSAGGSKDIAGQNYEWAVGETVVFTGQASNILVTQGVLQPPFGSAGISDAGFVIDNVSVYPVPSKGVVTLKYDFPTNGQLDYHIADLTGKTVLQAKTASNNGKIDIDMETFPNGLYLLQLYFAGENGVYSAASYKLEKIN